jgi:hypothetical protein
LFVDLAYDLEQRRSFLADPETYLEQAGLPLADEQRAFLMLHFTEQADELEIAEVSKDDMAEAMFSRMLQDLID